MRIGYRGFAAALLCVTSTAAYADDDLRPLCPDRPGKGTSACTVDEGHFQIEIDAFDATYDNQGGVKTTATVIASPLLKYGVTDNFDIEAGIAPYMDVRTKAAGKTQDDSGNGDLYLRGKMMLSADGASLAAAIEPFVKIPTADKTIGNGAVEGGIVVPLSLALDENWSLGATPELDVLKNAAGASRHVAAVYVVGLGRSFEGGFSAGAELWGSTDFDPAGQTQQYSFDLSAAWQPESLHDVQFDGGVNFGLNRATPDTQIYVGISKRF
jgi:hypothetical protein